MDAAYGFCSNKACFWICKPREAFSGFAWNQKEMAGPHLIA